MQKIIVDSIVHIWGLLTKGVPEAKWKNDLRQFIYQRRPFLHKEFLVNKGDNVVLVGCPRPEIVEKTLRLVGTKGKVVLIEADPTNVKVHRTHFDKKDYSNLSIIPRALSSSKGKGTFLIAPFHMDHRLVIDGIDMDNDYIAEDYYLDQIEVQIDTLDSIAEELGLNKIDYVEITVNGAEFHVLKGMPKILKNTQRLFIKAHAIDEATGQPLNKIIAPFLKNEGFETLITIPSKTHAQTKDWGDRSGDVFAWNPF